MTTDSETPPGSDNSNEIGPESGGPADGGGSGSANPIRTVKEMHQAVSALGRNRVIGATLLVIGIGGLALLFTSAFSMWFTSQPSFCAKCHPMVKFVDGWKEHTHSEVSCEECHISPGLFGFIGGKIAGLQVVMNYVRGNYEDYSFSAAVSNGACLRCHEGVMEEDFYDPVKELRVSHRNIIGAGAKCVTCHNTVGHGDAVPPGAAMYPTMDKCLNCHNNVIAPMKCELCHTDMDPNAKLPPGTVLPGGMPGSAPITGGGSSPAKQPSTSPSPAGQ
jgi:nitrate/TMAO reductase-like tetraheme cytochrome c subunit